MNPVFETFASLVIWAEPGLVTPHRTKAEVLKGGGARLEPRLSTYLPEGASRLTSGLLSLMAFSALSWDEAIGRLAAVPVLNWREAISPPSSSPERILNAVSSQHAGSSLLAEIGLPQDPEMAAIYRTLITHPKNLRAEIITLLEEAWRMGLSAWYKEASADGAQSQRRLSVTEGTSLTLSPLMLRAGEMRVVSRVCSLALVPWFSINRATEAAESSKEPAPQAPPTPSASDEPDDSPDWAAVFRGLSDGTRLRVLAWLSKGPSFPSVIAHELGVSLPTMSHHLAALKAAGLIRANRKKGYSEVSIDELAISNACDFLEKLASGR